MYFLEKVDIALNLRIPVTVTTALSSKNCIFTKGILPPGFCKMLHQVESNYIEGVT